jgi:hypothetical protein
MAAKKSDDRFSDEEAARRFEAAMPVDPAALKSA